MRKPSIMKRPISNPLTLYTFAMSHYSEKIRWTLDHCKLPYSEVCMTPAFHMGPALRMGRRGQTTLPILKTPSSFIQDSPRILDWLSENYGPLDLMPNLNGPAIRQVEKRFDAIGKDVARFLYAKSFGVADAHIIKLWTDYATPLQATVIRVGYPIIRWAFKQKLQISAKGAVRAQTRITEVIDWLESQLQDGRFYLVGGRFSAADITAAALLAPIACPAQHPVYGDPLFKQSMALAIEPWKNHKAIAWVQQMYDVHRGSMNGGVFTTMAPMPKAG
jgi:glutathione S-transferase